MRLAAPLAVCTLLAAGAAEADSYAAACAYANKVRYAACRCEGHIAGKILTRDEINASIAHLRGRGEQFKAMVLKLGADKVKAFQGKVDAIAKKTEAECRG